MNIIQWVYHNIDQQIHTIQDDSILLRALVASDGSGFDESAHTSPRLLIFSKFRGQLSPKGFERPAF
jgi:hypothetical protein